jgi:RHS repeat-associated protein
VVSILGASGNDNYTYDAYGNIESSNTNLTSINPYRYSNYYYDNESCLYYLNARYYAPRNLSFTQRDTYTGDINSPSTLNLYMYCGGNPIMYTDPSGHLWDTVFDVVGLVWSVAEFAKQPSLGNGVGVLLDTAGLLIPFVPSINSVRMAKRACDAADAFIDTAKAVDRAVDTADAIYDASKAINRVGDAADSARDIYKSLDKLEDSISSTKRIIANGDDAADTVKRTSKALKEKNKAALIESVSGKNTGSVSKALDGGADVVKTPYGDAVQSLNKEAKTVKTNIENGGSVYRGGTLERSNVAEGQFWAPENPLNPGYADRYGVDFSKIDFIVGGKVKPNSNFITRPAPGLGTNVGGAIEIVTDPNSVILDFFYMP